MPLNANILSLLRQQNPANASQSSQGVNPNLEMILQAMGMMPRQLDMQGRPIVSGVQNPSLMDQHYARQSNPDAMRARYSSPTFAMGANDPNRMAPATKLPGQGPIVAHQPISGLPGQVGPAYSTQMTPINMTPSADENAQMDAVRRQYRETMFPKAQTQTSPWRPNDQIGSTSMRYSSFGVPQMFSGGTSTSAPQMPAWQGPPVPDARTAIRNFQSSGTRSLDLGTPSMPSTPSAPQQDPMDVWETQMPPNPPVTNPMDAWAAQMPQNTSPVPQAPAEWQGPPYVNPIAQHTSPVPQAPAEWQGPPYVNPIAQHMAQLGGSALQQFPALGAFASAPEQKPYSRIDTSGPVWQSLMQKGVGAQTAAQTMFGAFAPPKAQMPLRQNPAFQSLVRKVSFR